jgi:2-keto-4-pentenoate hydratase/2-oxohepta-3-ene-1,7-dioic acid hydratase in catechol pathway
LLRHITAAITLYPGDLIPTGTPSGVGPMQPGDTVEVMIEGIETLSNPVIVG